jgi:hypothetical protein
MGKVGFSERVYRLVLTFIAKKYVAWAVASWFLWEDKVTGTDWIMLTGAIFAIDAWSKRYIPPAQPEPQEM